LWPPASKFSFAGIRGNGAENSFSDITYSFPVDPAELGCGLKGKRDYVMRALLVGCALRHNELAELEIETIQQREGRWVLTDLEGNDRRICDNPTRILAGGENGEYRVTATGESSDGKPIHTSYVLREDGKDYPVANAPFDSIAVTRIDANTSIVIAKRHGKVIGKTRVVVAGNTMTETTEGVDLTGKAFHAIEVLEKQ
jgi:hypothetical protein